MTDRAARLFPAELPQHLHAEILDRAASLLRLVDGELPPESREDGSQSFAAYVVICATLGVMHGQSRSDTGTAIAHALAQVARRDCPNQASRTAFIGQVTSISVMMTEILGGLRHV